jgi:5'-3' exonuclease
MNLTLIDISFLIHTVYFRFEKNPPKVNLSLKVKQALISILQPAVSKGFTPILVFDKKDSDKVYWRQKFIEQLGESHYSKFPSNVTNRNYKEKSKEKAVNKELMSVIKKAAFDLTGVFKGFGFWGLEADDYIGLICKYKSSEDKVDIFTGDRDLAGLVDDSRQIRWIQAHSTNRYSIETEAAVIEFFKRKVSAKIKHPNEVYYYKAIKGDSSDNLPRNCSIELVDLINHSAPIEFGFEVIHKEVQSWLLKK